VPQSYAESYFWEDIAAARAKGTDEETYAKGRNRAGEKLPPEELSKVQQRAAKWFAEHAPQP